MGSGTGVKRLKFGAVAWPPRTVTSFWSHIGRSWPENGLPPPAMNAGSVTVTVWLAPTQGGTMPACWDVGDGGGSAAG